MSRNTRVQSVDQKFQKPMRRGQPFDSFIPRCEPLKRTRSLTGRELFGAKLLALILKFAFFFFARDLEAAGVDELNNLAQLIPIEPGSMALTNIDDHARTMRKIDSVHQLTALGTGHVTNFRLIIQRMSWHRRCPTKNHRLFF